jgi:glycerophosphoryl diester phosphodiesterase
MMKRLYFFLLLIVSFALVPYSFCYSNTNNSKVAAVEHMANNAAAVDWAAKQGANGVEVDLNFNQDGTVKEFIHGGICDCTFDNATICRVLRNATGDSCDASETPDNMMLAFARNADKLAVVYIDSKLSDLGTSQAKLEAAGRNVIQLLDKAFENGYQGQVIISSPKIIYSAYLKSAIEATNNSHYKSNYYFQIDEEPDFTATMQALVSMTPNRVYSTGITASMPTRFYTEIELAGKNLENSSISGVGIWTIDAPSAMRDYLNLGANMVLTNEIPTLLSTLSAEGKTLAKPGELFTPATSDEIIDSGSAACRSNSDCSNRACGRGTAADNAPLICCPSGSILNYWGYDYCTRMPSGSICWSDNMCASGSCINNWGGTKKGICR